MAWTASLDVSVGDPTRETDYDNLVANVEFGRDSSGYHHFSIANTFRLNFDNSSEVWSLGGWTAADGRKFILVNTADTASFARGDADGYLMLGDIDDVPTS